MRTLLATAAMLLCSFAHAVDPSDSGWYQTSVYTQCNVVIDKLASSYQCYTRLSVMCMQGGLPYVHGAGSFTGFQLPITLALYRPQTGFDPVGSITITSLGSPAGIVLNGEGGTWHKVAAYTGSDTCSPPPPVAPTVDALALARWCRQHPTVPACAG